MTKTTNPEDDYFIKEQAEQLRALAAKKRAELAQVERERLKTLHYMHCPKCGLDLHTITFKGVDIDKCFSCGGVYLDNGELEKLSGHEQSGVIHAMLGLFKSS